MTPSTAITDPIVVTYAASLLLLIIYKGALILARILHPPLTQVAERKRSPEFYLTATAVAILILVPCVFASVYDVLGLATTQGDLREVSFGDCLYFSYVTWTTVGFGDLYPSVLARSFAALQGLLGYTALGLLVAVLARQRNSQNA